jgi:hypothetical protein
MYVLQYHMFIHFIGLTHRSVFFYGSTMDIECSTVETRVRPNTVNTKGQLSTVLRYIYLSNLNPFIYNKPYQLYGVDQQRNNFINRMD